MIEREIAADLAKAEKNAIRQLMRGRRKALSAAERACAAAIVCDKLMASPEVESAFDRAGDRCHVCAVYLAAPDEISLAAAIEGLLVRGVTVVAPRWNGKTYELARMKGLKGEHLRKGPMGILEPKEDDVLHPNDVAAWLVPGLAFTADGRRLGYGGGWYDRLMAEANKSALKLGIAYAFQVVESLPSEPHDIRLDAVVDDSPVKSRRR